jgi:hypothetical protein
MKRVWGISLLISLLLDCGPAAHAEASSSLKESAKDIVSTASMGVGGVGAGQFMQGRAEQSADAAAEVDARAYLSTFYCDYGHVDASVRGGDRDVMLPDAGDMAALYSEYMELASRLRAAKHALGLAPGIEAQLVLDKAEFGLYENAAVGSTSGMYASVSRALSDDSSNDAAAWNAQKAESSERVQTGKKTAVVGIAGGFAANKAIDAAGALGNLLGGVKSGSLKDVVPGLAGVSGAGTAASGDAAVTINKAALDETGYPEFDAQRARVVTAVNRVRTAVARAQGLKAEIDAAAQLSDEESGAKKQVGDQIQMANAAYSAITNASTNAEKALTEVMNIKVEKAEINDRDIEEIDKETDKKYKVNGKEYDTEETAREAAEADAEKKADKTAANAAGTHISIVENAASSAENKVTEMQTALSNIKRTKDTAKVEKTKKNAELQKKEQEEKQKITEASKRAEVASKAASAAYDEAQKLLIEIERVTSDAILTEDESGAKGRFASPLNNAKAAIKNAEAAAKNAKESMDSAFDADWDEVEVAVKAATAAERQQEEAKTELQKIKTALESIEQAKQDAKRAAENKRAAAAAKLQQEMEDCAKKAGHKWIEEECIEEIELEVNIVKVEEGEEETEE